MPKTITEIINNLNENDSRRDWWRRMYDHIHNHRYVLAMSLLMAHSDDVDFKDQVWAVANEILKVV